MSKKSTRTPEPGLTAPAPSADALALLARDEEAARAMLLRWLDRAEAAGDGAGCAAAAAGLLVATNIEFADFRALSRALPLFLRHAGDAQSDARSAGPAAPADPATPLLLDMGRIVLPLLDGDQPFSEATEAAAERMHRVLCDAQTPLAPDECMLALKTLLDHRGHQLDRAAIEQVIAIGHEIAARPGVSAVWRGRWWLLVMANREWFGDVAGAAQALAEAQRLVQQHSLLALRFELACVEMSAALKAADLPLADRLFRELDALRPAVRPGRLPHGLRAQALVLAARGDFAAALERLDLLLAVCRDMAVPPRDVGPYHVLRADCLLALGRYDEALALLEREAGGQQGPQRALFDARIAVHRASRALEESPGPAADASCRSALEACAALGYSRFLRPLPQRAARLVERGLELGVAPEFLRGVVHDRRLVPADPMRPDWPWRLRVQLLGPLQVWRDGLALAAAPSAKAQRKPMELLRLLVAQGGRPVPVSVVIDELWPSLELDAPRASFEMAVSRLRRLLDLPEAVRVADDRVSLDPALTWTDVAAFEAWAARGTGGSSAARALALYQAPLGGTEPLQGLMRTARERLALAHATLAQAQGEHLLASGDAPAAVRTLQSAVIHEPLNEPLHRALMSACLQQGERAECLRAYRRLQSRLVAELGIEPSPETQALAARAAAPRPVSRPAAAPGAPRRSSRSWSSVRRSRAAG
jgi:DNA-binding SARP family transcriptional activator